MAMGVCGYIEADGKKYWKPNMAALEGDLGRRIIEHIKNTPRADFSESEARVRELNERIGKAIEDDFACEGKRFYCYRLADADEQDERDIMAFEPAHPEGAGLVAYLQRLAFRDDEAGPCAPT